MKMISVRQKAAEEAEAAGRTPCREVAHGAECPGDCDEAVGPFPVEPAHRRAEQILDGLAANGFDVRGDSAEDRKCIFHGAEGREAVMTTWLQRANGSWRRSDERASVLLIHLNAGWRWLPYDRVIHDYVGEESGYDSWQGAAAVADALVH